MVTVNEVDIHEEKAGCSGEPARRDRKNGVAVIMTTRRISKYLGGMESNIAHRSMGAKPHSPA